VATSRTFGSACSILSISTAITGFDRRTQTVGITHTIQTTAIKRSIDAIRPSGIGVRTCPDSGHSLFIRYPCIVKAPRLGFCPTFRVRPYEVSAPPRWAVFISWRLTRAFCKLLAASI